MCPFRKKNNYKNVLIFNLSTITLLSYGYAYLLFMHSSSIYSLLPAVLSLSFLKFIIFKFITLS